MKQKQYIKAVVRKLKCSGSKKKEIEKQLYSDIGIALEEGSDINEVLQEMGSVSELAAEFNENMPKVELQKAKRAWIIKIIAALIVVLIVLGIAVYWWWPKIKWMDEKSRFDKEIVEQKVQEIIELLDCGEYEILREDYADDIMYPYLTEEYFESVKIQLNEDWGKREAFGNSYMTEVSQQNEVYAIVEKNVTYENVSVIYTLTFDEEMELAGLYIR